MFYSNENHHLKKKKKTKINPGCPGLNRTGIKILVLFCLIFYLSFRIKVHGHLFSFRKSIKYRLCNIQ